MRFIFSSVVALLAVVATASPLEKRTVAQVEADIATISSQAKTLDNDINAFPNSGGSLVQALAIHTAAVNLDNTLKNATTDANNTPAPISESDGNTILNSLEAVEPTIDDALKAIVAKKPAFDALPLGGVSALVKQDLQNLNTDTTAFANALIAKAPSDLVSTATAFRNRIQAAFATAIQAYASA